ncbi:MAG TPA: hypothetical protein VHB50_11335, partial [Bryobacteraceae bacterium]|nr:hypothetical protein [Bryobacteraceae bacterium]
FCALADEAEAFAARVVELLENEDAAAKMAERARREVESNWDMPVITEKLVARYDEILRRKRKLL